MIQLNGMWWNRLTSLFLKEKRASITTAKWEEIEARGFVFQKLMLKMK